MALTLGSQFPNLACKTSDGDFDLHDYQGDNWLVFFSHPADFTPVCTTELGKVSELVDEFTKRNVKCIALSCDSVESHKAWAKDVMQFGCKSCDKDLPFPIIADESRDFANKLGMIDPSVQDNKGLPLTCRAVFIVDPKHALRLSILYPASVGRNFNEIFRAIDALQLTDKAKVATPVNWQSGDRVIIPPNVSAEDAKNNYPICEPVELPSGKGYLRYTKLA